MFGLFKRDPIKKLVKEQNLLLEKAMHAQRNGNMALFANLSYQADEIRKKIEDLEKEKEDNETK